MNTVTCWPSFEKSRTILGSSDGSDKSHHKYWKRSARARAHTHTHTVGKNDRKKEKITKIENVRKGKEESGKKINFRSPEPKDRFTSGESEIKGLKKKRQTSKKIFTFDFAVARCEWAWRFSAHYKKGSTLQVTVALPIRSKYSIKSESKNSMDMEPVADLHSKILDAPPSKLFQFHAGFGKNLAKSYVGALGGLAPPPRGNPGSATGNDINLEMRPHSVFCRICFWHCIWIMLLPLNIFCLMLQKPTPWNEEKFGSWSRKRRIQNFPLRCQPKGGRQHIITARNEVGARLCFYTCLWFCSQGGCLPKCMLGYTPTPGSSACWEIRATSGRYASYWNAYLFSKIFA